MITLAQEQIKATELLLELKKDKFKSFSRIADIFKKTRQTIANRTLHSTWHKHEIVFIGCLYDRYINNQPFDFSEECNSISNNLNILNEAYTKKYLAYMIGINYSYLLQCIKNPEEKFSVSQKVYLDTLVKELKK